MWLRIFRTGHIFETGQIQIVTASPSTIFIESFGKLYTTQSTQTTILYIYIYKYIYTSISYSVKAVVVDRLAQRLPRDQTEKEQ